MQNGCPFFSEKKLILAEKIRLKWCPEILPGVCVCVCVCVEQGGGRGGNFILQKLKTKLKNL